MDSRLTPAVPTGISSASSNDSPVVRFELNVQTVDNDSNAVLDELKHAGTSPTPILNRTFERFAHLNLSGKVTMNQVATEKGAFADVHEGRLEQDGIEVLVAVKRLRGKIEDGKSAIVSIFFP